MIETLNEEEYSFFLAHGVKNDRQLADLDFIDNVMEYLFGDTCTD